MCLRIWWSRQGAVLANMCTDIHTNVLSLPYLLNKNQSYTKKTSDLHGIFNLLY